MSRAPQHTPSAFALEKAFSALSQARQRIIADDPDLVLDEAALQDTLGATSESTDALALLDALIRAAGHAEDMADAAKAAKDRLAQREARYRRRYALAKEAAHTALEALGWPRHERADFTFYLQRGKPGVTITDIDALEDRFIRTEKHPRKAEIATAIADGEVIEGAERTNGIVFPVLKRS